MVLRVLDAGCMRARRLKRLHCGVVWMVIFWLVFFLRNRCS
jgi:hypothetical protein